MLFVNISCHVERHPNYAYWPIIFQLYVTSFQRKAINPKRTYEVCFPTNESIYIMLNESLVTMALRVPRFRKEEKVSRYEGSLRMEVADSRKGVILQGEDGLDGGLTPHLKVNILLNVTQGLRLGELL